MDTEMHNKYFRSIAYNTNPSVSWINQQAVSSSPLFEAATSRAYEEEIEKKIKSCEHVSGIQQFVKSSIGSTLCLWFNIVHEADTSTPPFYPVSTFFGIWHEYRRGGHNGMHSFPWMGRNILIINTKPYHHSIPTYAHLMPVGAHYLSPSNFRAELIGEMRNEMPIQKGAASIAARSPGVNCNEVMLFS
jgi:hypothetical protein